MNNNLNINSDISKYIFNKNKFSLSNPSITIKNQSLDYCKKYSLKNKKAGFNFYGKNNICNLYSNNIPTNKLDNNLINNYSIKKFNKNNKQKNANINEQSDVNFYFNELNHFNLHSTGLIKKNNVENVDICKKDCLNTPGCNSITYFQQPIKCNFYDNVELGTNRNINYDSYTLNSNQSNQYIIDDEEEINNIQSKEHKTFHSENDKYTKCFTDENHNNYNKLINNYNNICKKDLGQEYTFSNHKNNLNVVKCDNNKIKILCKPTFIEKFSNNAKYKNIKIAIFVFFVLLVLFLRIIIPTKTGRRIIIFITVLFLLFILWITGYLKKIFKK